MSVITLTEQNFSKEVKESAIPVLVDFWAPWCGPCRAVGPIVDEIAKDLAGKLKVGKVNVDDEGQVAAQFNIMSIPTLLIFKNGQVVDQIVGALPKDRLLATIKPHLS